MGDFHWNCFLYRKPDRHLKEYERVFPKTLLFFHGKLFSFFPLKRSLSTGEWGKKQTLLASRGLLPSNTPSSRLDIYNALWRAVVIRGLILLPALQRDQGAHSPSAEWDDDIYWVLLTPSPGTFSPLAANSDARLLQELQWLPLKSLTFTLQQQ